MLVYFIQQTLTFYFAISFNGHAMRTVTMFLIIIILKENNKSNNAIL